MKAKVHAVIEQERICRSDGVLIRLLTSARWFVSCPCRPDRALAAATTWETAFEIAAQHVEVFHRMGDGEVQEVTA